jgi:hypothetical protein
LQDLFITGTPYDTPAQQKQQSLSPKATKIPKPKLREIRPNCLPPPMAVWFFMLYNEMVSRGCGNVDYRSGAKEVFRENHFVPKRI